MDLPHALPDDPTDSGVTWAPVREITATGPGIYAVRFDDGELVRFTATEDGGFTFWGADPYPFQTGPEGTRVADPRPVLRAVQAFHTAGTGAAAADHPLVARAVRTAREDPAALRSLIDWPTSGVRRVVGGLAEIPERDRASVVTGGLGELDAAAGDLATVAEVLRPLAARFAACTGVRVASPAQRRVALAGWQVPELASGLTDAQQARLTALRDRAAALDDVLMLLDSAGELPVAPVPGTELLAVQLPD